MAECLINKTALPQTNVYFKGFECRNRERYLCPNYMHNMVNGCNCRLLQKSPRIYAKLCLRSTLEPIKKVYKGKSSTELNNMFNEYEEEYKESTNSEDRARLRAQLGAIEELMAERGA